MPDVQIAGELIPIGGGLPIHASQFQVVLDGSEVTLVFLQRVLQYGAETPVPTISHRVVGQISLSHMLAKDMKKQLGKALDEFEKQYPIPELQAVLAPPGGNNPNAGR